MSTAFNILQSNLINILPRSTLIFKVSCDGYFLSFVVNATKSIYFYNNSFVWFNCWSCNPCEDVSKIQNAQLLRLNLGLMFLKFIFNILRIIFILSHSFFIYIPLLIIVFNFCIFFARNWILCFEYRFELSCIDLIFGAISFMIFLLLLSLFLYSAILIS